MIYLALYQGKGDWANELIRKKGRSPYSHCELIVNDYMYSSTVSDKGVRRIPYSYEIWKSPDWEIIPVLWVDAEDVVAFYEQTKHLPYGWKDIVVHQLFNFPPNDNRGDFCSEWCAKALGIPDAQMYDPAKLERIVKWANKRYLDNFTI